MSEVKVIFTLDGEDILVQCFQEEKLRDICQRFTAKIGANLNSFIFLYGGNHLNLELKFNELVNSIDKINHKMTVLVYKKEHELE